MRNDKHYITTNKYIKKVEEYLTERYGGVSAEWGVMITLLADNLDLYKDCKESVKQNGLYDTTTGKKNPLLSTIKDIQATIIKQIQHLGLSPYAASKIKKAEVEEDDEDFIEGLTNE